jgi:hypothetical protein
VDSTDVIHTQQAAKHSLGDEMLWHSINENYI